MKEAGKWKISKVNKMKSCPSILSNRERNKLSKWREGKARDVFNKMVKFIVACLHPLFTLARLGWKAQMSVVLRHLLSGCKNSPRTMRLESKPQQAYAGKTHTHLLQYSEIVWLGNQSAPPPPRVKVKKVASLKKISTGNCRGFDNKHS